MRVKLTHGRLRHSYRIDGRPTESDASGRPRMLRGRLHIRVLYSINLRLPKTNIEDDTVAQNTR